MPAEKCLRADRKAGPALARKQPAGRSEQGPVDGRVLGPFPTATEDRELVAQHNDLELPLITLADEQAKKAAEEPVQQRHQHDAQSEPTPTRSPAGPSWPNPFLYPTRLICFQVSRAMSRQVVYEAERVILA